MEKIRPNATVERDDGNDGRDWYYYIEYRCPKCNKRIKEKDIACTDCGTFFDWSKRAFIQIVREVIWE